MFGLQVSGWKVMWPWRWAWLGWAVALALLIAGGPLFLRMPLWTDANLYDVAAQNLLRGGVHYRDVFDTNLPGFVWLLTGLRAALGPSIEAARAVDLLVFGLIVGLVMRWARWGGASAAEQAWAVAASVAFYLFISEFNHLQRDVWMMLPALLAAGYRFRRLRQAAGLTEAGVSTPAAAMAVSPDPPTPPTPGPGGILPGLSASPGVADSWETPRRTDWPAYVGRDWAYAMPADPSAGQSPLLPPAEEATGPFGDFTPSLAERRPRATPHDPPTARGAPRSGSGSAGRIFFTAVVEGWLWGLAAWIKPHIAVIAFAVWLALIPKLAGHSPRPLRRVFADLVGVLIGGGMIAAAGCAGLIASGSWPYFLDVMQHWNRDYLQRVFNTLPYRLRLEFSYHPPWSLLTLLAVPWAVLLIIDGRLWSRAWHRSTVAQAGALCRAWRWALGGPRPDDQRLARALLATIYIAWVGMALFLQHPFHYAHVPEVLLMIGLLATTGWAVNFIGLVAQLLITLSLLNTQDTQDLARWRNCWKTWTARMERWGEQAAWHDPRWYLSQAVVLHPAGDPERYRWWADAWKRTVSRAFRNGVAFDSDCHAGVDWVQLGAVEDFLRSQNIQDGQLLCWHDSPCVLYRWLGIAPGFRYLHVSTATLIGAWHYEQVKAARDAAQPRLRYVVYDLSRVLANPDQLLLLAEDGLPRAVPPIQRTQFPLNQPIRYRSPSGRYVVAEVKQNEDLGECRIPVIIGQDVYLSD